MRDTFRPRPANNGSRHGRLRATVSPLCCFRSPRSVRSARGAPPRYGVSVPMQMHRALCLLFLRGSRASRSPLFSFSSRRNWLCCFSERRVTPPRGILHRSGSYTIRCLSGGTCSVTAFNWGLDGSLFLFSCARAFCFFTLTSSPV